METEDGRLVSWIEAAATGNYNPMLDLDPELKKISMKCCRCFDFPNEQVLISGV
jgi:hypothetical protein